MALRLVRSPTAPAARAGEVDAAVVVAAAAGDDGAARAFVACYERRVFTLCLRLLGDRAGAEDAAQDAFWKAFAALPRFDVDGPARVSTWLLTIATRHCLDELRKQKRRAGISVPDDDDDAAKTAVSALRADDGAAAAAARRRLEAALLTLPDEQRAVFALRVLLEQSVDDVAAALDVDAGTVKSRLSRARAALAAQLGELR